MSYLETYGARGPTPQSQPIASDQVRNDAGGYAWEADDRTRLRRFLILGTEHGTYYASERTLTLENVEVVRRAVAADGPALVREIVEVSRSGRAPKNDPALYALATAISLGDAATKSSAAEALPLVARTGTHLYQFVAYAETMRGWGRTLRWAVGNWYRQMGGDQLALQAVKYRQRGGWSHRDLLRLSHPPAGTASRAELEAGVEAIQREVPRRFAVLDWITHGTTELELPRLVEGFERAQRPETTAREAAGLVAEYGLPWEALQPEHLRDALVWRTLLGQDGGMPLTAMVRNLGRMSANGALDSAEHRALVSKALDDQDAIRRSRLHPMNLLMALRTYQAGRGLRGGRAWRTHADVLDALDAAFYLAFGNVQPSGHRMLVAVDVSGSMGSGYVAGLPMQPAEAAAAMALIHVHVEDDVEVVGFAEHVYGDLGLSRRQRLDDAVARVRRNVGAGTDASAPIRWLEQTGYGRDVVVAYTDGESWAGPEHVAEALDRVRRHAPLRYAFCATTASKTSLNRPGDPDALDLVGLDSATPELVGGFARGDL